MRGAASTREFFALPLPQECHRPPSRSVRVSVRVVRGRDERRRRSGLLRGRWARDTQRHTYFSSNFPSKSQRFDRFGYINHIHGKSCMTHQTETQSSKEYRTARKLRGHQWEVACLLGVNRTTIMRREIGVCPVTIEAWLALTSLPLIKKGK